MSGAIDPRLARLLGGEALAGLRLRLRRHFGRQPAGDAGDGFRLDQILPAEREALASLMGRRPSLAGSIRVDVAAIDAALRAAGIADSLRMALELLDGPIVDQAALRAAEQARLAALVGTIRHLGLKSLLGTAAGRGLVKRLSRRDEAYGARLCDEADAVLGRLPAQGIPRAQMAAETLGDAHALDTGRPVATLVLAVLRRWDNLLKAEPSDMDGRNETVRDIWARVGVLVNELARPALFLNLPLSRNSHALAEPGQPGYASLRLLLRTPPAWSVKGRDVFICENANLLAIAADRLGARCAPLVCTDGMPAAAQRTLLNQLAHSGARLFYHGDFDWPGIGIGNFVIQTYGARPWRFTAADYKAAISSAANPGFGLSGPPIPACWDALLSEAMILRKLAIAEEGLAATLLVDL